MCTSEVSKVSKITDFGLGDKAFGITKKRDAKAALVAAGRRNKIKKEEIKAARIATNKNEIRKFSANIASGGVKRAANV